MKCKHSAVDKGFEAAEHCPICLRAALADKERQYEACHFKHVRDANELAACRRDCERLREALQEISLGKGTFSLDHFQHCKNTVEDMKTLAKQALEGDKP